ncbi:MAG: type II secretion system protein N [Sphingorhabdus sp.]
MDESSGAVVAISLADQIGIAVARARSIRLANVLIAALGIALAIQVAQLFWLIVTPVGPVGDWRSRAVDVMPPAARMALFNSFDPFFRTEAPAAGTDSVTSLNLTLFGIRANESSGGGSAIIGGEDGVQLSYAVGDEVIPGVTLDAVAFDHVILSRGGVKESLYLDQSVPAETVNPADPGAANATAPSANKDAALNADTLQKSIAFAPRKEGGRVTGLVLTPRDDGTMLRLAGFQPGDIVVAVNGRPVSSTGDIASQIRPGARLSIEVERGANKVPIALNME